MDNLPEILLDLDMPVMDGSSLKIFVQKFLRVYKENKYFRSLLHL
jgi:hypothetical protein